MTSLNSFLSVIAAFGAVSLANPALANNSPPCPAMIDVQQSGAPSPFAAVKATAGHSSTTGAECAYQFKKSVELSVVDVTSKHPICTVSSRTATCTDTTGSVKTYTCDTRANLSIFTPAPAGMTKQAVSLAFDKVENAVNSGGTTDFVKCFYKDKVFTAFQ